MPAVYATEAEVRAYITARYSLDLFVPSDEQEMAALLDDAERLVDWAAGPWPVYADGRKFSPALLPLPQQDVLRRATAEAVAWLLASDASERVGSTDYYPEHLKLERRAGRYPQRVVEVMSGSGLMAWSGTVSGP